MMLMMGSMAPHGGVLRILSLSGALGPGAAQRVMENVLLALAPV